jgi:hypothetical protein
VGANPKVAQQQMRHSDARITLGAYAHVSAPFDFVYGPGERNDDLYAVHSTGEENGDDRHNRTFVLTLGAASLHYGYGGPRTDRNSTLRRRAKLVARL